MSRIDWGPSMLYAHEDRAEVEAAFHDRPWRLKALGKKSWFRCEGPCRAIFPGKLRKLLKPFRGEDGVLRTVCAECKAEMMR